MHLAPMSSKINDLLHYDFNKLIKKDVKSYCKKTNKYILEYIIFKKGFTL